MNVQVWNDGKPNDEVKNENAEALIDNEVAVPPRGNDIAAEGPAPRPRWTPPPHKLLGGQPSLPLAASGDGNDIDDAGDFNDYYDDRYADYDGHGGDHSDNATIGSTTGVGNNRPADGRPSSKSLCPFSIPIVRLGGPLHRFFSKVCSVLCFLFSVFQFCIITTQN